MKTKSPRFRRSLLRPLVQELETRTLFSYDVIGIQPAALDQPQVNAIVRLTPTGDPLRLVPYFVWGNRGSTAMTPFVATPT